MGMRELMLIPDPPGFSSWRACNKADVLVELISWFKPGTPFAKTGGEEPKREARAAVLKGRAAFSDPTRFEKFDPH